MKKHNYTHTGLVIGDNRSGNIRVRRQLRELKNHWVDNQGFKYRKSNGGGVGDWPMYMLDINTIQELPKQENK